MLLSKRPENMASLVPWKSSWPPNVWAMVTGENQDLATSQIPYLLEIPAKIRGFPVEPMLSPVDLGMWIKEIQWVIVGGESGPNSRALNPKWIGDGRDQCLSADVPFFFKQWGNWIPYNSENNLDLKLKKNINPSEIMSMRHVSKKEVGSILDGRTWKQLPQKTLIKPSKFYLLSVPPIQLTICPPINPGKFPLLNIKTKYEPTVTRSTFQRTELKSTRILWIIFPSGFPQNFP